MEEFFVILRKFVKFHKDRVKLLKGFAEKKIHGRLIYQVCFLGFESLAKVLYKDERSSKKRFIKLVSIADGEKKATHLYDIWRNALFHQGFIGIPWNTLENWEEYDVSFIRYSENKMRSSVEYPPESMIAIYDNLIDHLDENFKKQRITEVKFEQ